MPGMEIISLIREVEEHQMVRSDYCSGCWQEIYPVMGTKTESRGYWRSKIEPRKQVIESNRAKRALTLIKELLNNREKHLGEIFVLALFLARARLLALRQEFKEEGMAYQLYEILHQDEFITIQTIALPQIEIEAIQQVLAQKLSL